MTSWGCTSVEGGLGERAVARCDQLGVPPFSERADQLTRRYLTPAHAASLEALRRWMREAGMSVRCDGAANLVGRYEGLAAGAPALLIGSHIDTVRAAGRYDGALGVLLGIDCVDALSRARGRLPFAGEVIAFGDEEGSRFPTSMTCSRAVAGTVDPGLLAMRDADGLNLDEARAAFAEPLGPIAAAARAPGDVLAYLEAHIEQGPVLEARGLPVGVVTAIAAQKRLRLTITGVAGHAGTTPMSLRRDPGPAAAEAILLIERICGGSEDLVGTVGRIEARPGAYNVIPGSVEFTIDIRAPISSARDVALESILAGVEAIVARRGLGLSIELVQDLPESPSDPALTAMLEAAVRSTGVAPLRLASGAAHDAMVMAALCPTAMLFIRCKAGVSHNPAESVDPADAAVAARAMLAFIDALADTPAGAPRRSA